MIVCSTCYVCLFFLLGVDKAYPHDVIHVALEVCRSPPFNGPLYFFVCHKLREEKMYTLED